MNNVKRINYVSIVGILSFVALLAITFHKLIHLDPILSYDDVMLIDPITKMKTISQYWNSLRSGYLYDLQPVRDLSYWLDFKLISLLPFYSYHLTNVFIWSGISLIFKKILNIYSDNDDKYLVWVLLFMFAFNPVATSSIAWLAARKHLLASLFIILATYITLTLKNYSKKEIFSITALFLLSVFSHPITSLWPIWFITYTFKTTPATSSKMNWNILVVILLISSAGVVLLNQYHYTETYIQLTGFDKYDPEALNSIGLPLLALGRYFYLTVFPFDALPSAHYQGSWQNIAGVFLVPLFVYAIYKIEDTKKRRISFLFLLLYFLPLIPVTFKITRIFCSDTYLLSAVTGVYLVAFIYLKQVGKFKYLILVPYCLFLAYQNINYANVFTNVGSIWKYSYFKEANPDSALRLASIYTSEKKFKEAELLIYRVKDWDPYNVRLLQVALRNIYKNSEKSIKDKIAILEKFSPQTPLSALYLSILYDAANDSFSVQRVLPKVINNPYEYFNNFSTRNEETIALYFDLCSKHKVGECEENFARLKLSVKMPNWDEKSFQTFLLKYKGNLSPISY